MIRETIEVIKANKKEILKKTLIVGGTILGLGVVLRMVNKRSSEEQDPEVGEDNTSDVSDETSEEC